MRHRKRSFTLSRTAGARRALARKLAIALVRHGKLQTTDAKARFLRAFVEPLVTTAKPGDLAARRRVLHALADREATAALLKRAEGYRTRPGGYTRLTKVPARRAGDGTALTQIEFV